MVEEECFNTSKRRKIEETVLEILKTSDLETATEFGVRAAASDRLGFDLSGFPHRRLVRQLVDSFLLSTATAIINTTSSRRNDGENHINNSNDLQNAVHPIEKQQQQRLSSGGVELQGNYDGKIICKLSDSRRVTVHDFHGATMVSIRDFYVKDGNMIPCQGVNSGISLPAKQWASFRNNFTSIQEAVTKLESRLRSGGDVKQREVDMTNPVADSICVKSLVETEILNSGCIVSPRIMTKQTEASALRTDTSSVRPRKLVAGENDEAAGTSGSIPISNSQEQLKDGRKQFECNIPTSTPAYTNNTTHPETLVPIQTARLDGRNYHSWRHQMEHFLKQLNLAYVLTEPCPVMFLNPESAFEEKNRVQAAVQRWNNDDYMCRHNILNSLSDSLFQWYSQKICSARDLWEELKMTYDEDFGTKRSQINKYIHFQMVDGVSVLDQVQELQMIANSIMASGTWINENFHVSVIISKLPPSWKEFRVRLMHEDFVPLNMLMHLLQVEEEYRNSYKKEAYPWKGHTIDPKFDHRAGMKKTESRRVCYSCGKEGHIIKNCPDRKFVYQKGNEKDNPMLSPRRDPNGLEAET